MSDDQRQELLEYFDARKVWVVEADSDPPKLSKYVNQARSDSGKNVEQTNLDSMP